MGDTQLRELLRVLGFTATIDILNSIKEGRNQYKHFIPFASIATLNKRTKQLINLEIIEHHLTREDKRREWYTLTEKGKRALKIIKEIEKTLQKNNHDIP